jgi:hypothetical protein
MDRRSAATGPDLSKRALASEIHPSDSHAQRRAEPLILAELAAERGIVLAPRSLSLPEGARVDIDGVSADETVFVEVFAHQGRLKGGQCHKVAQDALKLITLARGKPNARLVLAFGDEDAAKSVCGRSWLAEALRTWKIEVFVAKLNEATREDLRAAQVSQVMRNPIVEVAVDPSSQSPG